MKLHIQETQQTLEERLIRASDSVTPAIAKTAHNLRDPEKREQFISNARSFKNEISILDIKHIPVHDPESQKLITLDAFMRRVVCDEIGDETLIGSDLYNESFKNRVFIISRFQLLQHIENYPGTRW